jgi:hypothetical protein
MGMSLGYARVMRRFLLGTLLVSAIIGGCKESAAPKKVVEQSTGVKTSTHAPIAANGTQLIAQLPLRLQEEAKSRPAGTPAVEAVLEAFNKAGFPAKPPQQVLGAMVHAKYCASSSTLEEGIGIALCEYADDAAAEEGKDFSLKSFAMIPDRELFRNKKTTLMLRKVRKGDDIDKASKRLVEVFSSL